LKENKAIIIPWLTFQGVFVLRHHFDEHRQNDLFYAFNLQFIDPNPLNRKIKDK
jgi:hypothetical protein